MWWWLESIYCHIMKEVNVHRILIHYGDADIAVSYKAGEELVFSLGYQNGDQLLSVAIWFTTLDAILYFHEFNYLVFFICSLILKRCLYV